MMRLRVLCTTLFTLGIGCASGVYAADGTITFEGRVNSTSCILDTQSKNLTVMLPSIEPSAFSGANSEASSPAVKFTLKATGCDVGLISAAALLSTGGNVDSSNGNLNNDLADGTDAQVRIYRADGVTPVNLAEFGDSLANSTTLSGQNIAIDFYANYFSKNATATPGLLRTSIEYTMQYL